MSNQNQQPVGAILSEQALNAAAKLMAEQFDYPWDFMPEQGRQKMRDNVKAIYGALKTQQPSGVVLPERKPILWSAGCGHETPNHAWNACLDEIERLNRK